MICQIHIEAVPLAPNVQRCSVGSIGADTQRFRAGPFQNLHQEEGACGESATVNQLISP